MSDTIIPLSPKSAVEQFATIWGEQCLAGDVGASLTCTETEALADLFEAFGYVEEAQAWRHGHAAADDGGDMHNPDGSLRELDEHGDPIAPEDDGPDHGYRSPQGYCNTCGARPNEDCKEA